jgi:hypothetical protein
MYDVRVYEEQAILGCAVEGDSSSHHGGRHGAGNHVMYGIRTVLNYHGWNKSNGLTKESPHAGFLHLKR